jgi:hypothetical protein
MLTKVIRRRPPSLAGRQQGGSRERDEARRRSAILTPFIHRDLDLKKAK